MTHQDINDDSTIDDIATTTPPPVQKNNSGGMTLKLSYKLLCIVLVVVILGMIGLWRPWQKVNTSRKINVNGEVTLKAEPDEFVFTPTYQKKNKDSSQSLTELGAMQKTVVDKLKELGVADSDIKASTGSYEQPIFTSTGTSGETEIITTLSIIATVGNKELAQKVQDYLITTNPQGQITPNAQFSAGKRKGLEQEARAKATDDAKEKAKQQAEKLDSKLGKVIEVSDGSGFDIIRPMTTMAADSYSGGFKSGNSIQPGQNDFTFTVSVTFALK